MPLFRSSFSFSLRAAVAAAILAATALASAATTTAAAQEPDAKEPPAGEALRGDFRGDRRGSGGIELFNGQNFSGDRRFFPGEESNLARAGFNDQAVSVRLTGRGAWQLCDDAGFRGRCVFVNGNEPDLNRLGLAWRVSAIRPVEDNSGGWGAGGGWGNDNWSGGRGPEISLFERDGYGGRSVRLRDGIANLNNHGFNDTARSLRTRGRWIVCEHANFEGRCRTVQGDLWDLNGIGLANRVSSLRPADDFGGGYDPGYPGGNPGGSVDYGGAAQGRSAVFFPRPAIGGQPVVTRRSARGAADDFCRRAGMREAGYFSVDRGWREEVLADVLCVR
jgi:hypothetical protein